jgi:hypothetical protein
MVQSVGDEGIEGFHVFLWESARKLPYDERNRTFQATSWSRNTTAAFLCAPICAAS